MYRFSHPFNLAIVDHQNVKRDIPMGCYGLGTSRLMGSIVEAFMMKGNHMASSVAPY